MKYILGALLLAFCLFTFSSEAYCHNKNVDQSWFDRRSNAHYRLLMARLVEEEKTNLGGLALQIPTNLAVTQGMLESNCGKSLYARKWNNHFGLYSQVKNKKKIIKFNSPRESVRFYLRTLMNHEAYAKFRKALRQGVDDPEVLSKKIARVYAEDPRYYRKIVAILRSDIWTD
jgi:flagellum-specific peptidoglycan hydrolase FlgJ